MVNGRRRWRPAVGAWALAVSLWVLAIAPAAASTGPSGSGSGTGSTGGGSSITTVADPMVPGEVILKLQNAADLPAIADQYKLNPLPLDHLTVAPLYLMRIAEDLAPDVVAAALATDVRVAYAEPNILGAAAEDQSFAPWASGNGPAEYQGQWVPADMRLPQAFTVTRGAGVTVAVLDTGVDATHPALAGRVTAGYDFVNERTDTSEVGVPGLNPAFGHGTFIAGLVALAAPDARIMPVRVLDPNGYGDIWRLSKAMVWAASNGADVINLSLSTHTRTHVAGDLVTSLTATGRGVVVSAAAGNFASDRPLFPAGEGGARVLSVAATTPLNTLAPFSDYGSWVRVGAPGAAVLSSVPGGQYATWSGTSMSTGLASGTAALVRAAFPAFSAQDVNSRVAATATRILGAVPLKINAAAAVGAQ